MRLFTRKLLSLAMLLSVAIPTATGRTRAVSATRDRNYAAALAAADHFLQAWQSQNQEDGLLMLSDTAKQQWREDRLQEFFSTKDNAAYQICEGKKLKGGRYAFPVVLYGTTLHHRRGRWASEIVVVQSGKLDWAIDKLP